MLKISSAFVLLVLFSAPVRAQDSSEEAFEKLKSLVGKWTGVGPSGLTLVVTYELVSGGQAVVETRVPKGEPSMVSIFHLDNDELMMTHYCSVGNQPRMKADLTSPGTIEFSMIDVTGLSSENEGHMYGLRFDFDDPSHLRQLWTWREDGKNLPAAFTLERVEE